MININMPTQNQSGDGDAFTAGLKSGQDAYAAKQKKQKSDIPSMGDSNLGSNHLKDPQLGDSEGVNNQQEYTLGANTGQTSDLSKYSLGANTGQSPQYQTNQNAWDSSTPDSKLGIMNKRMSQQNYGGY
jgi:hypothetical protein